jgi:hypothetical protein
VTIQSSKITALAIAASLVVASGSSVAAAAPIVQSIAATYICSSGFSVVHEAHGIPAYRCLSGRPVCARAQNVNGEHYAAGKWFTYMCRNNDKFPIVTRACQSGFRAVVDKAHNSEYACESGRPVCAASFDPGAERYDGSVFTYHCNPQY